MLTMKKTSTKPNFLHIMNKLSANFMKIAVQAADQAQQQLMFRKPCSAQGRAGRQREREEGRGKAQCSLRQHALSVLLSHPVQVKLKHSLIRKAKLQHSSVWLIWPLLQPSQD